MNKGQVIGLVVTGLVVVGAVTVVQYLKKPKANKDGFYNASGLSTFFQETSDRNVDNFAKANLKTCKRKDGSYYQEQPYRNCINGAVEIK
jgi:hypothetical protein